MNNTLYTPHFSELELTESATARKYGIDNRPTLEVAENLRTLCKQTLEPLREALGLPVVITSGYRCKELNDIISHNSNRSQHLKGQAADFYVGSLAEPGVSSSKFQVSSARARLVNAFKLIITCPEIDFDQLILYPNFIHVSYAEPRLNRHYIMTAEGNGRYHRVTREEALAIA